MTARCRSRRFTSGRARRSRGGAWRCFSFLAFAAVNVVIDVESAWNLLQHRMPVHRFLHTFVGATLVIAPVAVAVWLLLRRRWPVSLAAAAAGAALGAWSHVLLDGIMHRDVRPFAPWSDANPFQGLLGVWPLHIACEVTAIAGILVCGWRWQRAQLRSRGERRVG